MIWYFGALRGPGHYLHRAVAAGTVDRAGPFEWTKIDGSLAPPNVNEKQGAAALVQRDGYTLLAWWDRTGDKRGNSNSALIVDRIATVDEVLAEGRRAFPAVMARQTAPIEVAP